MIETAEQAIDYIQAVLKNVPHDDRFKMTRPWVVPGDQDTIRVSLDFSGNGPPFSTGTAEFKVSVMSTLQPLKLDQYIEQELRDTDQGLRDFMSAAEEVEATAIWEETFR